MIKIDNSATGVKATLVGFSTEEVGAKIEACQNGACSCDCDPSIMEKIEKIELSSTEEGAQITITGKIDAKTLAPMMQSCLIEEKK